MPLPDVRNFGMLVRTPFKKFDQDSPAIDNDMRGISKWFEESTAPRYGQPAHSIGLRLPRKGYISKDRAGEGMNRIV